jgi:hypothetical protein
MEDEAGAVAAPGRRGRDLDELRHGSDDLVE